MSDLVFDKETHTYRMGGRVISSVTQAILKAGLIDARWFTEESRIRGTAVHEAIFYDVHNDLHKPSLHPVVVPYIEAWEKFKTQSKFKPMPKFCELRQWHPLYDYCGTPDLLGMLNGRVWLIDVKTGDCPTAGIQTAAYREFPKIRAFSPMRASLRLKPDGTYRLLPHENDANDFAIFLQALKISKQ